MTEKMKVKCEEDTLGIAKHRCENSQVVQIFSTISAICNQTQYSLIGCQKFRQLGDPGMDRKSAGTLSTP